MQLNWAWNIWHWFHPIWRFRFIGDWDIVHYCISLHSAPTLVSHEENTHWSNSIGCKRAGLGGAHAGADSRFISCQDNRAGFIDDSKIEGVLADELSELYLQLDKDVLHPNPNPWEQCDVCTILPNAPLLHGEPSQWNFLLKHADLDIFLNLSQEHVPDSILHVTHYGIWSLRSNNQRVTTSTGIRWSDLKPTGSLIHCVVEAQRGLSVQVVAKTVIPATRFSFMKNQKSLLWIASSLLPDTIKQLYLNGENKFFTCTEIMLNWLMNNTGVTYVAPVLCWM